MIALIKNWDLKQNNKAIRERQGVNRVYYASDLGSSFSRTDNDFSRTRNDVKDYTQSKFIQGVVESRPRQSGILPQWIETHLSIC